MSDKLYPPEAASPSEFELRAKLISEVSFWKDCCIGLERKNAQLEVEVVELKKQLDVAAWAGG